ncbi:RidA family protein, partial [Mesorhizobium sp. M8A.F.Ca.ET.023.01.1.1]
MSIRRIDVGPRMSQIVIHGTTVYLAGQVDCGAVDDDLAHARANIDA